MNVRNLSGLLLSLLTMVVLGCGGGGGGGTSSGPDAPATMTLTSSSATSAINTPVTITANVLQADGTAVKSGTVVAFATTGGTLSAVTTTNSSGNATAILNSAAAGAFTVTANVGSLPAKTVVVTFDEPNSVLSIAVTGAPLVSINSNVTLTATLTPFGAAGVIADGTVVTFTTSAGTVSAVTTTTNGVATATLSGITTPQTVSVKASAGVVTSPEININFVDPSSPAIISVTDVPGAHFVNTPVAITVTVTSVSGGTVPVGTPVAFAITSGAGTLSQTSSTTDANGNASVTLNNAVEGAVTVTITAAQATGSHTISFTNPNKPASIALIANRTSGVTNNLGPVTLTATLIPENAVNGVIADGTPVTFTILSGNGGTLSLTTANTSGGVASVTLNSTVAGIIAVDAKAGSTPVVTSNPVSVTFISQPTQVAVKVRTTGTLPAGTTIGGFRATVTASPSAGLSIVASPDGFSPDISATGAGVGSTLVSNSNNVAAVTLVLINTNGINTGEFATLNYNVAAGSFPTANDFSIALNGFVIDTLSTNIPGIGVEILSVTIQ